jgi:hypothetical protein
MKNSEKARRGEIRSPEEFDAFIDKSLNEQGDINSWIRIGKINEETQGRLKSIFGKSLTNINIDNNSVRHILNQKHHNMTPELLHNIVNGINTAENIELSDMANQDCKVIIFNKGHESKMTILAEAHISKDYLLPFSAWYKKGYEAPRCC